MSLRVFDALSLRRRGCAAIPVLAAIVFLAAAQSALAATSLTGEALTGNGPSTGGSTFGSCPNRGSESGSVGFNVASGTATAPYAGNFAESGSFSVSGYRNPPWRVTFSANFTIKSGSTTITGTFATPMYAWWQVGFICNSSGGVSGYSVSGRANYTAVINGQTYHGTASVGGTFYKTVGAQDSIGESVLVTYGQITGAVTDSATHGPLAGVCVQAYNSSGATVASAQTNAGGVYTLANVPEGPTRVGFSSGCGASNYLTQYYNAEPSLATADPVTVIAAATTPGIDAAMVVGGQITGTVTDGVTHIAIPSICVQGYNSSGTVVASTQTNTNGLYTISALPTGSYRVGFVECGTSTYVTQYYHGKASLASADPILVTAGATTSGIDAAMIPEGQISGTVTDSATHAPLAGISVYAYDSSGRLVGGTQTDASGAYTTDGMAAGSYRVGFFGASPYASQYYNGQPTLASADPVTVADGKTTSGINAAMAVGGEITGTVTDSITHAPVAGICVYALDSGGNTITAASTNASGVYTMGGLQSGSDRVGFFNCGASDYVTQYYNAKANLASADPVAVKLATVTSGINATMVKGGEITGTVTDSATHAPIFGICVDALDSHGNDVAAGYTGRDGAYTIYGAPDGARVEFYSQPSSYSSPSCGGTNYVTQYYDGKSTLASANPVAVKPTATTAGINAAMVAG